MNVQARIQTIEARYSKLSAAYNSLKPIKSNSLKMTRLHFLMTWCNARIMYLQGREGKFTPERIDTMRASFGL